MYPVTVKKIQMMLVIHACGFLLMKCQVF